MILFVFGIILLLAGLIGCFVLLSNENFRSKAPLVMLISFILAVVLIASSCVTSVPTGHTGIITTFGRVENYTFDAGVHFKAPWNSVVKMDNRVQKSSITLPSFSSDIQEVTIVYTLNYQIDTENAQELYRNVGVNYYDTVVTPSVAESVKVAVAQYTAEDLVNGRSILAAHIESLLREALTQYNINVVSTSIEDIDFTDAFTNAVEAKQVAQQNKLRAATEQEQRTLEEQAAADRAVIAAQAEAEVAVIQAQADLEVTKIQADAAEYAGQKEAARIKAISEQLTSDVLKYYYILQWNGILPETFMTDDNMNILMGIE